MASGRCEGDAAASPCRTMAKISLHVIDGARIAEQFAHALDSGAMEAKLSQSAGTWKRFDCLGSRSVPYVFGVDGIMRTSGTST